MLLSFALHRPQRDSATGCTAGEVDTFEPRAATTAQALEVVLERLHTAVV